jgi:hypothetical protein
LHSFSWVPSTQVDLVSGTSFPQSSQIAPMPLQTSLRLINASAGDATSTYPDYYVFALIKTKNTLLSFSRETLFHFSPTSIRFICRHRASRQDWQGK